jgi:uncharacterized protein
MKYFFDSYAIIEILKNNPNYNRFADETILTSDLNLGEVYYALLKQIGREKADDWFENFKGTIIHFNSETVIEAMFFRYKNIKKKLSMIDCIGYKIAVNQKLKFLTGDKEFEQIQNVEYVK